ncbi:hypothetical protein KR009_003358 [Drosophila setifemur]|nr:hypothetical protein KR009_003358 [Drosophila setifemur]
MTKRQAAKAWLKHLKQSDVAFEVYFARFIETRRKSETQNLKLLRQQALTRWHRMSEGERCQYEVKAAKNKYERDPYWRIFGSWNREPKKLRGKRPYYIN